MRVALVAIALAGMIVFAGCGLGLTASTSCEFPDGSTTYIIRRNGGATEVTQRSDGYESSRSTMGTDAAQRGALMIDAGDVDGTMLVLSSSDTTRVEVSGRSDLVPEPCEFLGLSLAIASVKVGDHVTVRGFNADDDQLFTHSGSVRANSSHLISTIGAPPSS